MKDTIINLTPPIDGVQYGISDETIKAGEWCIHRFAHKKEVTNAIVLCTVSNELSVQEWWNKIHFSTNPKDTRFPYLVIPSKEQEVERLALNQPCLVVGGTEWEENREVRLQAVKSFIACFNVNPAKYTQEQMEKALKMKTAYIEDFSIYFNKTDSEIIQSLQPTAKAVRVETTEEGLKDGSFHHTITKIKVETSSEHSQSLVKALEVIY